MATTNVHEISPFIAALPKVEIAKSDQIQVNEVLSFHYPTDKDPCLLIRLSDTQFVAYDRSLQRIGASTEYAYIYDADVFSIKGRGTVVTGRVDRGVAKKGDPISIVGLRDTKDSVITGTEMFHKELDEVVAGDNAGILLRGIEREDVERGQVLAKPGSITPHKKFLAEVYVLKKEEGGRHKAFFSGYRPQFYIRTMDVTGNIALPEGVEMVMPGDNVNLTVELIVPVALEQGSKFAIREGGRTVGAGVVTKIIA